jgi:hypothetical protein
MSAPGARSEDAGRSASERIAQGVTDALSLLDAMSDRNLSFDLTLTRQWNDDGTFAKLA